jgi:hypothetical protein
VQTVKNYSNENLAETNSKHKVQSMTQYLKHISFLYSKHNLNIINNNTFQHNPFPVQTHSSIIKHYQQTSKSPILYTEVQSNTNILT